MWESGEREPRLEMLEAIADYFNISTDYLLGVENMENVGTFENTPAVATPHIIVYFDILGTKDIINNYPEESTRLFQTIYNATIETINMFNSEDSLSYIGSIKYKIFSDNVLLAIECTDNYNSDTFINKLTAISSFVAMFQCQFLIKKGLFIRGGICLGDLYIDDNFTIGIGLIHAYNIESQDSKYPQVLLDQFLVEKNPALLKKGSSLYRTDDFSKPSSVFINYLDFGYVKDVDEKITEARNHYYVLSQMENEAKNKIDKKERESVLKKIQWAKWYHNIFFEEHNVPLFNNAAHPEAQ